MTDEERLQDLWQELDKLTEVIKKQSKQIHWLNDAVAELQKREKAADAARRARAIVKEAQTGEEE